MEFTTISAEEICALTNQDKRARFLEDFKKWSKVLEVKELNQTFYGCVLPNAQWIIAKEESVLSVGNPPAINEARVTYYYPPTQRPLKKDAGKTFEGYVQSEYTLIKELKELKMRIEEDK